MNHEQLVLKAVTQFLVGGGWSNLQSNPKEVNPHDSI